MTRNKRPLPARLITAFKITAILFLFVFLCFAAPGRVSKRDSGAVARDQVKPAKTAKVAADTASAKAAPKKADTVLTKITAHRADSVLPKNAAHTADTAKQTASVKKDTISGQQAAARLSMDSSVAIATSEAASAEKKIPQAAASPEKLPATSSRMLLVRIIVFLASAAIIIGAVNVVRKQTQQPRFLTTTRLSVMDKEVQKACRYIEKNYSNPELTVKSICADLVTGEAFLEALMERELGITVGDFITHVRINRARVLLEKDPSLAKEAAAQQTGFSDAESFDTAFKKITSSLFDEYSRLRREKT
jgi:YesN/AraC family two-component response regulator